VFLREIRVCIPPSFFATQNLLPKGAGVRIGWRMGRRAFIFIFFAAVFGCAAAGTN